MKATFESLAAWLTAQTHIALITHMSPDGDALGATLALALTLERMGKRVTAVCQDPVPHMYRILPEWQRLRLPAQVGQAPPAALALDCADEARMGEAAALFRAAGTRACLDHHASNAGFGDLWVVVPTASATGELVLALLDALGQPLAKDAASLIYAAIATDTGNFSQRNVTPASLRATARCLEAGADIAHWSFLLFRQRTLGRTRLIGRALSTMELSHNGAVALLRVYARDFEQLAAERADTEHLVDFGIELEGVRVSVLLTEQADQVRASFRSRGDVDVSRFAAQFGGGGHKAAAGATLACSMDEAGAAILRLRL